jgi:hypothetical protein
MYISLSIPFPSAISECPPLYASLPFSVYLAISIFITIISLRIAENENNLNIYFVRCSSVTATNSCYLSTFPPGSAFIYLSWIRILIGIADPDPEAWKLTNFLYYVGLFNGTVPSFRDPYLHPSALSWLS